MAQERPCDPTEVRQQWLYDAATLTFRHAFERDRCIDFFVAHEAFGVWSCRDAQDVNSQQQFRYDEANDKFCLLAASQHCLQEAISNFLY